MLQDEEPLPGPGPRAWLCCPWLRLTAPGSPGPGGGARPAGAAWDRCPCPFQRGHPATARGGGRPWRHTDPQLPGVEQRPVLPSVLWPARPMPSGAGEALGLDLGAGLGAAITGRVLRGPRTQGGGRRQTLGASGGLCPSRASPLWPPCAESPALLFPGVTRGGVSDAGAAAGGSLGRELPPGRGMFLIMFNGAAARGTADGTWGRHQDGARQGESGRAGKISQPLPPAAASSPCLQPLPPASASSRYLQQLPPAPVPSEGSLPLLNRLQAASPSRAGGPCVGQPGGLGRVRSVLGQPEPLVRRGRNGWGGGTLLSGAEGLGTWAAWLQGESGLAGPLPTSPQASRPSKHSLSLMDVSLRWVEERLQEPAGARGGGASEEGWAGSQGCSVRPWWTARGRTSWREHVGNKASQAMPGRKRERKRLGSHSPLRGHPQGPKDFPPGSPLKRSTCSQQHQAGTQPLTRGPSGDVKIPPTGRPAGLEVSPPQSLESGMVAAVPQASEVTSSTSPTRPRPTPLSLSSLQGAPSTPPPGQGHLSGLPRPPPPPGPSPAE